MRFRYLTSGESHGQCLNAIIEGVPSGFEIDEKFINKKLALRQSGYGRGDRMTIEKDTVKIKSGVRFGITTGAPICVEIVNKDWENWQTAMSVQPVDFEDPATKKILEEKKITKIRPGHADLAGAVKYDHKDIRNVLERSSARGTAIQVAVGAIAENILNEFDIKISPKVLSIGGYETKTEIKTAIDKAKSDGDTLGGKIEAIVHGLPIGLGSHVHWDRKLDGLIAQAVMSIQAIKAVEIGAGTNCAFLHGSKTQDEIGYRDIYTHKTNNAGGIEGGMTNGEPVIVTATMKSIPTMKKPLNSIEIDTHKEIKAHFERSDTCAVEACAVVVESMLANVIIDAFLEKFGADSFKELKANYDNYIKMAKKR